MKSQISFDQDMLSLDYLIENGFDVIDNDSFNSSDNNTSEPIYKDARWAKLSAATQLVVSSFKSIDDAIIHAHRLNFFKKQPSWTTEVLNINK